MKTLFKALAGLAVITTVAACTAYAADQPTPKTWGPGWRHEQMIQAQKDGTFTPGYGPGMGRGMGPGMGRGMMAANALGPDGKIDPTKLPADCPYRQSLNTTK
jgi:hypothetical protein